MRSRYFDRAGRGAAAEPAKAKRTTECSANVRLPEPLADFAPRASACADGPPDPVVYDGSARALRQRTVNFAAKRIADMMYVTGLDQATAERHLRWRARRDPGESRRRVPDAGRGSRAGRARSATGASPSTPTTPTAVSTVRWTDPAFGPPIVGIGHRPAGLWRHLLGATHAPRFDPQADLARARPTGRAWPVGDAVNRRTPPAALAAALDALFAELARYLRRADRHRPIACCSSATAPSARRIARRRAGR